MRWPASLATIALIAPIILGGCSLLEKYDDSVRDINQQLSDRAHEETGAVIDKGQEQLKEYSKEQFGVIANKLTDELKKEIDAWLAEQGNLNKYGDPLDTMYAGGTPLFIEGKNEVIDRYEYILERHPDLIEKLKLQ